MRVVTIASDLEHPFMRRMLVRSCHNLGLDLVVLRTAHWQNFSTKKKLLQRWLSGLDDASLDELILFTDAYDAVFLRGNEHILERYHGLGHRVLFSAERNCWPLGPLGFPLYGPARPEPMRYLNSGGYVGRAGDILALQTKYPSSPSDQFELLRVLASHGFDAHEEFAFSDQYFWTLVHLIEPGIVGLDHGGEIFDCSGPVFPNLSRREIHAIVEEHDARGAEAGLYRVEHERLVRYFASPSKAAHVHFAGSVTKAVVEDMLNQGELPAWLTDAVREDGPLPSDSFTVVDV